MSLRRPTVIGTALGPLRVPVHAEARDTSRDPLATDDGRAAYGTGNGTGTTGAAADGGDSGSERDLTAGAGRTPTLHATIDSAAVADREVARGAGAGRIP